MRVIVTPAVLPPSALAELKEWLGITTSRDDAPLSALLATGLDVCADFTGLMPLTCTLSETIRLAQDYRPMPQPWEWQQRSYPGDWCPAAPAPQWQALSTRPVHSGSTVEMIDNNGAHTTLASDAFSLRMSADGSCSVRVHDQAGHAFARVTFVAGLADTWEQLPVAIRHGIIRLAAHQHRTRETAGAEPLPPAAVSALWRPWRRMRLV